MKYIENFFGNTKVEGFAHSEGTELRNKLLCVLERALRSMLQDSSIKVKNYNDWQNATLKAEYNYFKPWMQKDGEPALEQIRYADDKALSKDAILDSLDFSIMAMQNALQMGNADVLCATIADSILDLAGALDTFDYAIVTAASAGDASYVYFSENNDEDDYEQELSA